mgnify:CR=1 FL=1
MPGCTTPKPSTTKSCGGGPSGVLSHHYHSSSSQVHRSRTPHYVVAALDPPSEMHTLTEIALTSPKQWTGIASSSDGQTLCAVVKGGGVWRSTDAGASWTEIATVGTAEEWIAVACSDDGAVIVAAVEGGGLWKSEDSGTTWVDLGAAAGAKQWSAVDCSSDGSFVVALVAGENPWITDAAGTLTEDASIGVPQDWSGACVSADGTKLAACVRDGNLWIHDVAASTWTEDVSVGVSKQWSSIACARSDFSSLVAVVDGGHIWRSADAGATWTEISSSSSIGSARKWLDVCCSLDGSKIATIVDDGRVWLSYDSGSTWSMESSISQNYKWRAISCSDAFEVLAAGVYGGGLFVSTDSQTPDSQRTMTLDVSKHKNYCFFFYGNSTGTYSIDLQFANTKYGRRGSVVIQNESARSLTVTVTPPGEASGAVFLQGLPTPLTVAAGATHYLEYYINGDDAHGTTVVVR